MKGYLLQTTE